MLNLSKRTHASCNLPIARWSKLIKRLGHPFGSNRLRLRLLYASLLGVTLVLAYALSLARFQAPTPTLLLLDRHGQFLAESSEDNEHGYGYWPVNALPERVVAATLALEDRRFWRHPGVDPLAIARAAWQNLRYRERISGASTIAMQVARMQNPGARSYGNKLIESLTALFLTARYGREAVLGQYLRLVPYGNNIHGIAYAARRYLDKPVTDLSWAEIAFLCAIPQAPGETNPFLHSGRLRAIERGQRILNALQERAVINAPEYALARTQLDQLHIPSQQTRPSNALHAILKLETELRNDRRWQQSHTEPLIRTSLDLKLQDHLSRLAGRMMDHWQSSGAQQLAVIVLERQSREVLAWLGSAGYFVSDAGAIDYTQVLRSPGSSLKPFVYAHAINRGAIGPGTILYDLPSYAKGFNNIDQRFLGPMLPRQALANSRNVPATHLVEMVGIDETYSFLTQLGLNDKDHVGSYYGLGMAIGTLPTTLERLVRAYGVLANDGLLKDLVWLQGGSPRSEKRLMPVATARLIDLFLSDPLARLPSFPRMGSTEYAFPVAVKTGTSQGYRDAWAVAFSADYLVGVWVGRPDLTPMRRLGGAGSAADLAQRLLLHLDGNGLADLPFPPPPDYQPYTVCALTGARASDLCQPTLIEWFPTAQPPEPDDRHLRLWVDSRTHQLADVDTPRQVLKPRTFIKIPAFLQAWGDKQHIATLPMNFNEEGQALTRIIGPADQALPVDRVRVSERPVRLTLESPMPQARILINPEMPLQMNTLALRVNTEPAVSQILWYVDGRPYQLSEPPFTVHWPMQKGRHTFQARLPFRDETSSVVSVVIE